MSPCLRFILTFAGILLGLWIGQHLFGVYVGERKAIAIAFGVGIGQVLYWSLIDKRGAPG